jgi:hypothetical protein
MVILDDEDHIVAVFAGRPGGDWDTVMKAIEDTFVGARNEGYEKGIFLSGKVAD